MTNQVRDRSGVGLPPKAERRALGKAAAEKRRRQRRNRQIRDKVLQIAAPIAVIAIIVGAVWLFRGGDDTATDGASDDTGSPSWMSDSFDPALATRPPAPLPNTVPFDELTVTPLIQGTGTAAATGHTLTVNYVGVSRSTGEEFDSSWSTGEPYSFKLGIDPVIEGWQKGLVGVTVGSRVELDIPSSLAYGDGEDAPVPGDLIFIVDVLKAE